MKHIKDNLAFHAVIGMRLLADHNDIDEDADDEDLPLMTFGGM